MDSFRFRAFRSSAPLFFITSAIKRVRGRNVPDISLGGDRSSSPASAGPRGEDTSDPASLNP